MAIFDWRDFEASIATIDLRSFEQRYESATRAEGVREWVAFVRALGNLAHQAETFEGIGSILTLTDRFVEALGAVPSPTRGTVFVSHQRTDAGWAERAAWEATEVGLDYWLDIHDVGLRQATAALIPMPIKAALIAGIIEMALLNCSHVVSMQTFSARGSRWVPYEFGRAKQRVPLATNAASWFEKGVAPDPNGDYLSLAFCAPTRQALEAWLQYVAGPVPPPRPNRIWRGRGIPGPLPN